MKINKIIWIEERRESNGKRYVPEERHKQA